MINQEKELAKDLVELYSLIKGNKGNNGWVTPIKPIRGMPKDIIIQALLKIELEKQIIKDALNECLQDLAKRRGTNETINSRTNS